MNCQLSSADLPESPPNHTLRQSEAVTMVGERNVHTQVCFPTTVVAKPYLIRCYGLTGSNASPYLVLNLIPYRGRKKEETGSYHSG